LEWLEKEKNRLKHTAERNTDTKSSHPELTTSPLNVEKTNRTRFDEEYNNYNNVSISQSSKPSFMFSKSREMDQPEQKINNKLKDFSLEHLHEARDLEALIHARKLKLEELESEIKLVEFKLEKLRNKNQED